MYYDKLLSDVVAANDMKRTFSESRVDILDCIAESYVPLHNDIIAGNHQTYNLPGGRGSCKSSFVSLEIVDGMMNDPTANAIIFRRVGGTLRESVYAQISWAIDALGVNSLWRGTVSPMTYTYKPTGQQIVFRGLDDAAKLKSIKPRHGTFKYVWFEEFSELTGVRMVRSVLQSVVRGGKGFKIFNSFNPPISINNWANKYILEPNERAMTFKTTYLDVPAEWLGESFILEAERLKTANERAYDHEYLGIPTGTGGEVFPNIQVQELTNEFVSQQQYLYCGIDFGFSVDPYAFIRVAYDQKRQTVYFLDEICKHKCNNRQFADTIKERHFHVTGYTESAFFEAYETRQTIICDCAEPRSIADLRDNGLKCIACKKYQGSVQYGIKWLQSKILVFDPRRTPNAYREFSEYEYETTKDGEFLADVPDINNHLIDATRYAFDRQINSNKDSA